jgi:hypothetical protein
MEAKNSKEFSKLSSKMDENSKENSKLSSQMETLLLHMMRPAPNPPTPLAINGKRAPESSPSPSGATKHSSKRTARLEPTQLEAAFTNKDDHEAITEGDEDDADSETMRGMEAVDINSRSNSPSFETANILEGSEAGANNTQPGSQES